MISDNPILSRALLFVQIHLHDVQAEFKYCVLVHCGADKQYNWKTTSVLISFTFFAREYLRLIDWLAAK